MSRCFPYPPPGYTRNGIRDEALIESIKLQREVEKAKKEGKKEKKREKKEKQKAKENDEVESKKHRHKKSHREERNQEDQKGREDHKGGDHQKRRRIDTEHFEKSSLTVEHGNPAGSQNSTDSTLNSNRGQNQCSPSDDRHNSGSIIRIRLPVQRQEDLKVLPSKGKPCTALGKSDNSSVQRMHKPASVPGRVREQPDSSLWVRSDNPSIQQLRKPASVPCRVGEQPNSSLGLRSDNFSIQLMHKPASGLGKVGERPNTSLEVRSHNPSIQQMQKPASVTDREGEEHPCSTSGSTGQTMRTDKSRLSYGATGSFPLPSGLCRSCPPSLALQFRDLVENWIPPELEIECTDLENESWLFEVSRVPRQNSRAKRSDAGSYGSSCSNLMSWPHAQYLPDADIHALPFTVPF